MEIRMFKQKLNAELSNSWRKYYWIARNVQIHKNCGGKIFNSKNAESSVECNRCGKHWSDEEFEKAIDGNEVFI